MSTPVASSTSGTSSTDTSTSDSRTTQQAIQQLTQQSDTPAVSFGGLVSGINTQAIVEALLAARRAPILQLQAQQANEHSKLIGWQTINTKLQAIQASASTLGLQATVNAKTAKFPDGVATGVVNPSAILGSFQLQIDQLATATQVRSSNSITASDVLTASAKLSAPVATGTFSVNGTTITISAGETFEQLFADVNSQTGGIVSGSIAGNKVQFSSSDSSDVVLGDPGDTSNFLTVVNLAGAAPAPQVLSSAAVGVGSTGIGSPINGNEIGSVSSKLATKITAGTFTINGVSVTTFTGDSINTILTAIATATGGAVTGTVTNNGVTLSSASNIALGSGGDTSNFLRAVKLLGQPAATSISSSGPVGMANPGVSLDTANIAGLQTHTTQGSFTVNGVNISFNSTKDTLADVLERINASSAGVTATYDPNADRVSLTSTNTGNIDISVKDGSGNLMARLGLTTAEAHNIGKSAKYEVNGGPAQYSLSNTISNLVPGVKVTLQATTGSAITASVDQDPAVGTKAVHDFVTAYNDLVDLIDEYTAYNSNTRVAGLFLGDSTLSIIEQNLNRWVFVSNGRQMKLTPPYTEIASIGLSTGDIGSAPGTTSRLKFDETKFQAALAANPGAVTSLVTTVFHSVSKNVLDTVAPFGAVDSAIRGENRQIDAMDHQVDNLLRLLSMQEKALTDQFLNLDQMLSQLQSQSSAGASVLSALAGNAASSGGK